MRCQTRNGSRLANSPKWKQLKYRLEAWQCGPFFRALHNTLRGFRAIRLETMDAKLVNVFFDLEEAYGDTTRAALQIQFDNALSSQEKADMPQYQRSQRS